MLQLYKQYLDETFDANGIVSDYQLKVPGLFNFAYDVVDASLQQSLGAGRCTGATRQERPGHSPC